MISTSFNVETFCKHGKYYQRYYSCSLNAQPISKYQTPKWSLVVRMVQSDTIAVQKKSLVIYISIILDVMFPALGSECIKKQFGGVEAFAFVTYTIINSIC